jgi:hypothetical protein
MYNLLVVIMGSSGLIDFVLRIGSGTMLESALTVYGVYKPGECPLSSLHVL